jgi:type I restriction enzyme M protein
MVCYYKNYHFGMGQGVMGKKVQLLDDDTAINVSTEVAHVWSIANTLRGTYKSDKYKDVITP